jgi:hypothetical protein
MILIISDDGMKLEASALSPRFGVVSDFHANGTMGIGPATVSMHDANKIFGLEVGGIAYNRAFLDANARKASLQSLEFLVH